MRGIKDNAEFLPPAKQKRTNTLPVAEYIGPRIPTKEIARRGEELYASLRAEMEAQHRGQFLSVDVETGEYAIGESSQDSYRELLARRPEALLYTLRIGQRVAGKI